MDARSLIVLKHIFGIAAALVGILAAWFEFRDRAQTEEGRTRTKEIYARKWIAIRDSGLLDLPERVISWLLKVIHKVSGNAVDKMLNIPNKLFNPFLGVGSALLVLAFVYRFRGALLPSILLIFLLVPILIYMVFRKKFGKGKLEILMIVCTMTLMFAGVVIWLDIALGFHIAYALAIILALLPFLIVFLAVTMLGLAILIGWDDIMDKWGFVGMATAASFSITLLSLLLGHLALPASWIPKTFQMITANVICDGLTMYATLVILSLAVKPDGGLPIPIAIVLDIVVGALLACASLYFGLIFTSHALSITEVCRVLVGLAPDGQHFEIGPYFWAMHTTFIPTLCYLSLIFFCWLGKLFVLPIAALLSKGQYVEKPHHLTAGALLLLGAIFTALFLGLGALGELASSSPVSPGASRKFLICPPRWAE